MNDQARIVGDVQLFVGWHPQQGMVALFIVTPEGSITVPLTIDDAEWFRGMITNAITEARKGLS